MSLLYRAITILGLTTALGGLAPAVKAQPFQASTAQVQTT